MKTLALETSGSTFGAALAEDGVLLAEVFWHSGLTHSERLVPAVGRLLSEMGWAPSSLERIAVSTGPGSFTGIRVGLTCARTMAQSLGIPLTGMTTLDLLAAAAPACGGTVFPAIDALRDEVYIRVPEDPGVAIVPAAAAIEMLAKRKEPTLLVGNAAGGCLKEAENRSDGRLRIAPAHLNVPRAGVLALEAASREAVPFERVTPLYIRRSWAEERRPADAR